MLLKVHKLVGSQLNRIKIEMISDDLYYRIMKMLLHYQLVIHDFWLFEDCHAEQERRRTQLVCIRVTIFQDLSKLTQDNGK